MDPDWIIHFKYIASTTYWGPDGKPISAAEFLERLVGSDQQRLEGNAKSGGVRAFQVFLKEGPVREAILDRMRDPSGQKDYLISKHNVASALQTLKTTGKMAEIMAKASHLG